MAIKIYLSPSDQTANKYAAGSTNEDKQCERIADACAAALKRCGFEVKNNKTSSMAARIAESNRWGADLHVPIHTNAFNGKTSGTRLFCWSKSGEGYKACKAIFNVLAPLTPGTSENITARQDLAELRDTTAVCCYVEADFHDVKNVAKWIIENVEEIGEAIAKGICSYFEVAYVPPVEEPLPVYRVELGEYGTIKEADANLGAIYAAITTTKAAVTSAETALTEARNKLAELETVLRKAKIVER